MEEIKHITAVAMPVPNGSAHVIVYGLGEDNKVYVWRNSTWILSS